MSHSKRNTSRAVFTSYERSLAKSAWNSTSARLTRESFLPFASCQLCLLPARAPVSCSHGDIFCRECALNNILSQKKEMKRLEKARQKDAKEASEDVIRHEKEARDRTVQDFERIQMGLEAKIGDDSTKKPTIENAEARKSFQRALDGEKRGEKRKFELDEDKLIRIAIDERAKVRRTIDDEKASKVSLASFWTPSATPSSNANITLQEIAKRDKRFAVCPASSEDKPHNYSLHSLINVVFTEEEDGFSGGRRARQRVCPSCKKVFSNTSKAMLAKPCGHVLCKNCVAKFMTPSGRSDLQHPHGDVASITCYVCSANLTETKSPKLAKGHKDSIEPGLVEIRSEGTGFAGGGHNLVQKSGVAFQC